MNFLRYWFYPNPGQVTYTSPSMLVLFAITIGLLILALIIKFWRARLQNASTKKLSRSWSAICFWFGLVGLILVVSRVEKIQFVAMRFVWVLWTLALLFAVFVQYRIFRSRHYEVLPRFKTEDPRAKYLPK